MSSQLDPMRQIVGQLKKDKDSANKKISACEKELGQLSQKLKVR